MGRYDGLKEPWKPGQSGNPKGKPKGTKGLTARLREILMSSEDGLRVRNVREIDEEGNETGKVFDRAVIVLPKLDNIIISGLRDAIRDQRAREWIFDRLDGKAVQQILHSEIDLDDTELDYSKLTMEEQETLLDLMKKARRLSNGEGVDEPTTIV